MKLYIIFIIGLCCLAIMTACVSTSDVASWHPDVAGDNIANIKNQDVRAIVKQNNSAAALLKHDIQALITTAKQLKKLETNKTISDSFWNSRNIFATSAVFALGQCDEKSFQQIVKNEPDFVAMRSLFSGKTRGGIIIKTIAIPQIVDVRSVEEAIKLPPEKRALWGVYAKNLYPEISDREFTIICNQINISRSILKADTLAETAIELGKYKSLNVPVAFQAKQLFSEAVDMAILLRDINAMNKIMGICKNNPVFLNTRELRQIEAELKSTSKTRGRGWNERKIAKLCFTELKYQDGTVRAVTDGTRSHVSYSNSNVKVIQYTGRDALAYKIKKFYEN